MTRREFTVTITKLVQEMIDAGEQPIYDYMMRSQHEQAYLFSKGLSKCDGFEKVSMHQQGKAIDLYLCHYDENNEIVADFTWNEEKAVKWHTRWQELGGREMIEWDKGHFEGKNNESA